MKKLTFLLIPLLLTSLVSSCALVTNDSEVVKQKTLRQIEQAKERAEQKQKTLRQIENAKARARQKLTPQKQRELREFWKTRRAEQRAEYAKAEQIEQELYYKEQEAKYKRFKEEWVEFIQSGDGSIKNKTTQEVKKLVDQWKDRWIKRIGMMQIGENARKIFLEDFSLENFYKIFGKPWKTQFIEDKYFLWYICKDGHPIITVGANEYDKGWLNILDLNIL